MLKAIILIQIFASLEKKSRLAGLSVLLTIQDPTLISQPVFPEETKACHLKNKTNLNLLSDVSVLIKPLMP